MDKPFSLNDLSHDHQQLVEAMKSQLLIVFVNRLGGKVRIPVSEVDGTGEYVLKFCLDSDAGEFQFTVARKDGEPNKPPVKLTELNEHTRFIFGRPNFSLSPFAHRLRALGHEIPSKSEDEQAHMIHFMLNLYERHGDRWREEFDKYMSSAKVES